MKAIVRYKYGGPEVLQLVELDKPSPAPEEVLVRVHASSVNPAEWYSMQSLLLIRPMLGLLAPKDPRLGADFAGVVEAVGEQVSDFKPGDEVFGGRTGAFAEYVTVRNIIAHKPANISFEEAAAAPTAAITALQGLRDHGKLQAGQRVLITGASGGVGTYAVQMAKAWGAQVTGVCRSQNVDLVRSLGADQVVDYTREDFTDTDRPYDLVLDIAGTRPWADYQRVMTPEATLVYIGAPSKNRLIGPLSRILRLRLAAWRASQKVLFFVAQFNRPDFAVLADLLASGKVRSVIDRVYPLGEAAEAMRYLGEAHACGKVVLSMQEQS
ncbi:MAG: NAD(P)-dependent alcohol dehydrogenase [Anaerolineales bacterium]|nr:NAD(P)-dependent alcohol dehydrogenase [Anaerolineales bacterium]